MSDSTNIQPQESAQSQTPKKPRRHRGLKIALKTLIWIVIVIITIPVLLYIPPVQTFVKNVACKVIYDKTGINAHIGYFRLKFPLDVVLEDVSVVTAPRDTMASVKEAVVDVKLLPLLKLDVDVNKLSLNNGYYKMVNADSSMVMKIRAGLLRLDDKTNVKIKQSEINIGKALLSDGDVQLYMNVWKKKPTPEDTTSTPFLINIDDLKVRNINFAMSMLPTIDTLELKGRDLHLKQAEIDLRSNKIKAAMLAATGGDFRYITPTPEYIKTHPAPVDTISPPSPPMVIEADSISLDGFNVLYAMKGARPQSGFDANYLQLKDVGIGLRNFYNCSSDVVLPLQRIVAKERCGLQITSGSGEVRIDSTGIALRQIDLHTPYSKLQATADIPFALMEMKPKAPVNVNLQAAIGMPDIDSFFPAAAVYTKKIPGRRPVNISLTTAGTLGNLSVNKFDAAIANVLSLRGAGRASNVLNIERLKGELEFAGELNQPSVISAFAGDIGVPVPRLRLKGRATADCGNYTADLSAYTSDGDLAARGRIGINSENYNLTANVRNFNLAPYIPGVGLGRVTANLIAKGKGFNPLLPSAATHINADIADIVYNGNDLRDISVDATLLNDKVSLIASAADKIINFYIEGEGEIHKDDYTINAVAHINHADLQALGLDSAVNNGRGDIYINGSASPERWLYDVEARLRDVDWMFGDERITLPEAAYITLRADENNTYANIESLKTALNFEGDAGLQKFITAFENVASMAQRQIADRSLDVDSISNTLPSFRLRGNATGNGLLSYMLSPMGVALDSLSLNVRKDSLLRGDIEVLQLMAKETLIDTVAVDFLQRGKMLDYGLHVGNRPGTLDEFAQVNLRGYLGDNRLSAYLNQQNLQGQTGYRLGFTASVADDDINLHFTPRKATIAYLPWTFNADNFVDLNLSTLQLQADLQAQSAESSISLLTEQSEEEDAQQIRLKLDNIHIEDFLQMSLYAPPLTASVDADLSVLYDGKHLKGKGTLGVNDVTYNNLSVGDFDFNLGAGMDFAGNSRAIVSLLVNNKEAMSLHALLKSTPEGLEPDSLGLQLTEFPLSVANAFIGKEIGSLSGTLDGDMEMNGKFTSPRLNGSLKFNDVAVYIAMMGSSLKFSNETVSVSDNIISFDDFDIWGANDNPLTINGTVNAAKFNNILLDVSAQGNNFQLIGNDKRARSDLYGKLFLNLNANAKGSTSLLDITGNVSVLSATDVTYAIPSAQNAITQSQDDNVVKFVNFSDTTQVAEMDSVANAMAMRIRASLTLQPGMQATVLLSDNGTDRVQVSPSGTLNYYQNFMGDMSLNGQLNVGSGFARYSVPVVGQLMFNFEPSSFILWNGDIMNPTLHVNATDVVKASVQQSGGNSHLVNFLVTLEAMGTLGNPQLKFDLSTDDDMSIQNELQSMSADQRQTQAMNLLLYGQYSGPSTKTMGAPITGNIYSFLASQVNSWAAKNIRGVDLSFGVDQYDRSMNGSNSTTTSYSYQVSKSLFNNKFKISVGGNYDTDSQGDDIADNLFSDVSLEYIIKQTNTTTMLVSLFRHAGYESILEGDVTETGVGFVLKRKVGDLRRLFRFGRRRNRNGRQSVQSDTTRSGLHRDSVKNNVIGQ